MSEEKWIVVRDTQERYSVWPDDRPLPVGWNKQSKNGSRDECLQHIKTIWTDHRPLDLRRAMA